MDIPPGGHYVSSGLMLFPRQTEAIDRILSDLRHKVPATLVILTARDGQFISAAGESIRRTDLVSLGSLIAGDLAASHQIAHLTGVYEEAQTILREGRNCRILVIDAGPHLALFVLTDGEVPAGWLRLLGAEAAKLLARIVEALPDEVNEEKMRLKDKSLADQFDKALGDLWNG